MESQYINRGVRGKNGNASIVRDNTEIGFAAEGCLSGIGFHWEETNGGFLILDDVPHIP